MKLRTAVFLTFALGVGVVPGAFAEADRHVSVHDGGGSIGVQWHLPKDLTFGAHVTTSSGDALAGACKSGGCSLTIDGDVADVAEAIALLEGNEIQTATVTAGYRMELPEDVTAVLSLALHWYHEQPRSPQPGVELRLLRSQFLAYASWHDLDLEGYTPIAGRAIHIRGEVVRVGLGFRF